MFNIKLNSILGVVILLWCAIAIGNRNNSLCTIVPSLHEVGHYKYTDLHDTIKIDRDIPIRDYFEFMDSLIYHYDSLTTYVLSEHLLVHANPWIIDSLKHSDYYVRKAQDSFVYDQKSMIVIPHSSNLVIPDSIKAQEILHKFDNILIDINIPEYKLRIWIDTLLYDEIKVRVGRNDNKFLEMSGRVQDLRTKTGVGTIVGYNRYPRYINPVNNHEYYVTRRDDGKVTKLPQIPFIETELNGWRHGQLIHPTTNPETLGKVYSNGCIGTSEADAWTIYYHSPIGTRIHIRYDLEVVNTKGDTLRLKDIYKLYE